MDPLYRSHPCQFSKLQVFAVFVPLPKFVWLFSPPTLEVAQDVSLVQVCKSFAID